MINNFSSIQKTLASLSPFKPIFKVVRPNENPTKHSQASPTLRNLNWTLNIFEDKVPTHIIEEESKSLELHALTLFLNSTGYSEVIASLFRSVMLNNNDLLAFFLAVKILNRLALTMQTDKNEAVFAEFVDYSLFTAINYVNIRYLEPKAYSWKLCLSDEQVATMDFKYMDLLIEKGVFEEQSSLNTFLSVASGVYAKFYDEIQRDEQLFKDFVLETNLFLVAAESCLELIHLSGATKASFTIDILIRKRNQAYNWKPILLILEGVNRCLAQDAVRPNLELLQEFLDLIKSTSFFEEHGEKNLKQLREDYPVLSIDLFK